MNTIRLQNFPVSFFSMILGMTGFTIVTIKVEHLLKWDVPFSSILLLFTMFLFLSLTFFYGWKILKHSHAVKEEFNHPIKLGFFPTFSISLLLLSIATYEKGWEISRYLWMSGALFHLLFTLKIVGKWLYHEHFEIKHMNPAWFIPAVGNILVPVVGIHHAPTEISWFFFSIGLVFWVALLTIFLNRIIFHNPLPEKLLPTFFILIAPPAVGFVAYVKMGGEVDSFARILYYFALFLTLLLATQIKRFSTIKFYLSWWAYSFPVSAMALATVLMYHKTGLAFFQYGAYVLFTALVVLIGTLLVKTFNAVFNKEICVAEH